MKRALYILLFIIIITSITAEDIYIYPGPLDKNDIRYNFQWKILDEALKATEDLYGHYLLRPSKLSLPETRHVSELLINDKISVIRAITNTQLEVDLLPVRIPVQKGTLGFRVFLINKNRAKEFKEIKTLKQLQKYSIGQGKGWGDVPILRYNGFKVLESSYYDGLFHMLINDRFDLFSRGITEAPREYQQLKEEIPDLYIEESLCIQYPMVEYFFFNRSDTRLAQRVQRGLELLIDNGTYNIIFESYFSNIISDINLSDRKIFKLNNPFLPKSVPINESKYWFTLDP